MPANMPRNTPRPVARRTRHALRAPGRAVTAALCALLLAGLAACADLGQNGPRQALTVSQRHPITVDAQAATLAIPVAPDATQLGEDDLAALDDFAARYKAIGHGPLAVSVPSGAPNRQAADRILRAVETRLNTLGLGPQSVRVSEYRASGAAATAPLIISFTRYVATPSPCGNWSEDYAFNPRNVNHPNFGCATRNNLARMVADPADLVRPRAMDPADSQRRQEVIDRYRRGETTQTERAEEESGAASQVNQQ